MRARVPMLLGPGFLALCACGWIGSTVPDTTGKITSPEADGRAGASEVLARKPWETWHVNKGNGRYHREAGMLLPDDAETFKISDIVVLAKDGSDVRFDYGSVELAAGSQTHERVRVSVFRATRTLDDEWSASLAALDGQYLGAQPTQPLPTPAAHPSALKQAAFITRATTESRADAMFVEVMLFHQGGWTVKYEITCPEPDLPAARKATPGFLASLRRE